MAINDLGTVRPGSTILIPFHTFDSNDPSASVTLTGLALADIGIYKGTSMTERASTTGVVLLDTDGIDIDATTGIHGLSIDLSSNATAGFYTAGSNYYVTMASVTVDAATVNAVLATFRIGYPGAVHETTIATLASQTSFTLTAGSADNSAYVGCPAYVHDVASAIQVCFGYVSAYTGATKTVTLAADPAIFTMAAGDNISLFPPANVRAVSGITQTGGNIIADSEAILVDTESIAVDAETAINDTAAILIDTEAISVATETIDTNVSAILVDTEAAITERSTLLTDTEAILVDTEGLSAGSGLTPLASGTAQSATSSTIVLAAVSAFANDELNGNVINIIGGTGVGQSRVITDYTGATDTATISPTWTTNPGADSTYEVVQGSANLETWRNTQPLTLNNNRPQVDVQSINNFTAPADALEDLFGNTATGTADSGTTTTLVHTGLTQADDFWNGSILVITGGTNNAYTAEVTDFVAATDTLTFAPAMPSAIDATSVYRLIGGLGWTASNSSGGSAAAIADAVWDEAQADHVAAGSFGLIASEIATIDTVVDAVLVDTEAVIVDTEAILADSEAILVDTGTTLLADTEAILADTNELQTDWTNAGRLDAILDAVLADTETGLTERATLLTDTEAILADTEALGAGSGLTALATGTAQSGTASTIVLAAVSAFADNVLNGNIIKIHTGTGAGQSRLITSNTLADDTCNVTPNWTTNPSSDSQYEIVEGAANVTAVSLTAQTAGDIIADTEALLVDTEANAAVLTDTEAILVDSEAILADTNELQGDWTNTGRLDTILDAVLADTEANTAVLTDTEAILVDSEAILVDTGTTLLADTEAILADTNELQGDWTNTGRLDTILDAVLADTETGLTERATLLIDTEAILTDAEAILVDTGTTIPGTITTLQADTDDIQTRLPAALTAGGNMKSDILAINGDTASAADLEDAARTIVRGTVDTVTNTHTPTTTEFQADDITEATADHYNGRVVIFTSGVLTDQATDITDYVAVGGIGQFTVTALTEAPANNDTFVIV